MAKAVALIAFAIGVLALAGNVQGHVEKDKLDVDPKNNSSLGVYGSVFCVTCNNGTENDWKPLGSMYNCLCDHVWVFFQLLQVLISFEKHTKIA